MDNRIVPILFFLALGACGSQADDTNGPFGPYRSLASVQQGISSNANYGELTIGIAKEACEQRAYAQTDGYTTASCVDHLLPAVRRGAANKVESEQQHRCHAIGVNFDGAARCSLLAKVFLNAEASGGQITAMRHYEEMQQECAPSAICKTPS